ncbi:hypothetical protein [Anaerostipes caccae]
MAKSRNPIDLKIEVAKAYLNGEGSYGSLSKTYSVGHKSVEDCSKKF